MRTPKAPLPDMATYRAPVPAFTTCPQCQACVQVVPCEGTEGVLGQTRLVTPLLGYRHLCHEMDSAPVAEQEGTP